MFIDEPEWQTRRTRIDAWLADWGVESLFRLADAIEKRWRR